MKLKAKTESSPVNDTEAGTIDAAQATVGCNYKTMSKPPVRVIFKGFTPKGECLLDTYHAGLQEWKPVAVPKTYKLIPLKEGEKMPEVKSLKKKSANSTKALGSISGKAVYPTWGLYFKKYGHTPNAAKAIAEGMAKEFPGRKTMWSKWVNSVRNLYNAGRLEVPKPTTPLKPFKDVAKKVAPKAKK